MMAEERPNFVIETERIYKLFENEIDVLRQCEPSKKTDISLREIVLSSYIKAYDFVLYLCSLPDYSHSFFQLPVLRGICEDLIALTYILQQTIPQQNYILIEKRYKELNRSSLAQKNFFNNYNTGQILPPIINENVTIDELVLLHKEAGHDFEQAILPKVYRMAEQTNLKHLYDFIYHATSKTVHFDIFTLLSMGWGEIDQNKETIKSNFSYKHDYKHYYSFALFYSSYLFLMQTENFKSFLMLPDSIEKALFEMKIGYEGIDWPLLVTFRQLNANPPSELTRSMYRIMMKNTNT